MHTTVSAGQMDRNDHGKKVTAYFIIPLLLLVFLAYYPILNSDFTNYDDPSYVTSNNHVKSGLSTQSIKWAFSTFYSYNWHPLTWISHMLDVQLFGLNPMWHHLNNLFLHIVNSLLLFTLFEKMTGATWKSLCLAGLFALHPLHVESVAWVAERKDVLSTFFLFLATLAYVEYARNPKAVTYVFFTLLFILGLMAKPMLVTLPLVLLLMDYWPLGRLREGIPDAEGANSVSPKMSPVNLVLEKVPLVLISIASMIITYFAQRKGGALSADSSLIMNAGNALLSYVKYALKMLWPSKLAAFYPYNPAATSGWQIMMAIISILIVSALVIRAAKRFPYLAVGWLWYLGTFVPVIGFVRIGQHAMADRYTYIPLIGLFVVVVWGIADLARRLHTGTAVLAGLMIVVFALCAVLTNQQTRKWHDSITLFSHALEVTENNWLAHKNLGAALANQGKLVEALKHVSESLRIKPETYEYMTQGWLYLRLGNYEKAIDACKNSIAMSPDNDKAHFILGVSYIYLKDFPSAIAEHNFLREINSPYALQLLNFLNQTRIVLPVN
jgi:protein O-mannosyl-transferase